MSIGEKWNPCEYRRRVESEQELEKGIIQTSTKKGFELEPGKVDSRRVPEKGRVWLVSKNGRIGASTGKGSGGVQGKVESRRVPEKGRIRASTGEG